MGPAKRFIEVLKRSDFSVRKTLADIFSRRTLEPKKQPWTLELCMDGELVGGLKYCLFSPRTLGKWSNLTNIFQMGWNHQQDERWNHAWMVKLFFHLGRCLSTKYLGSVQVDHSKKMSFQEADYVLSREFQSYKISDYCFDSIWLPGYKNIYYTRTLDVQNQTKKLFRVIIHAKDSM